MALFVSGFFHDSPEFADLNCVTIVNDSISASGTLLLVKWDEEKGISHI